MPQCLFLHSSVRMYSLFSLTTLPISWYGMARDFEFFFTILSKTSFPVHLVSVCLGPILTSFSSSCKVRQSCAVTERWNSTNFHFKKCCRLLRTTSISSYFDKRRVLLHIAEKREMCFSVSSFFSLLFHFPCLVFFLSFSSLSFLIVSSRGAEWRWR